MTLPGDRYRVVAVKAVKNYGGEDQLVVLRRVVKDVSGGWWNDCSDEYELAVTIDEARELGHQLGRIVNVVIEPVEEKP